MSKTKSPTGSDDWIKTARTKAEIEANAKRDAMLAEVEEAAPPRSRLPKKVGQLVVKTGLKVGYHDNERTFDLRLTSDGKFAAIVDERMYLSRSRDSLIAKLETIARAQLDVTWARYIVIRYEVVGENKGSQKRWYGDGTLTVRLDGSDDKREDLGLVYQIGLRWKLREYSSPFTLEGATWRLERGVDDDGKPEDRQERADVELPAGLVEYTPGRVALLEEIRKAMTALDRRLVEQFTGNTTTVAKKLDAIADVSRMIGAGK